MSGLYNCGICCMIISVWGFVQLLIMGILFNVEAVSFFDEAEEEEYEDYEDFIKKTSANYKTVAHNCWIAAILYFIMIGISYCCINTAKRKSLLAARRLGDEQTYCEEKSKVI